VRAGESGRTEGEGEGKAGYRFIGVGCECLAVLSHQPFTPHTNPPHWGRTSVEHTLGTIALGTFAVKKIPVGDNVGWLVERVSEVRLLAGRDHVFTPIPRHAPTASPPPVPNNPLQ